MNKFVFLLLLSACAASHTEPDMPVEKQTVVTPGGLVTQPNKYGEIPPGTLSVADNIMIRRPGVIEPRPLFEQWSVDFPGGGVLATPVRMWRRGAADADLSAEGSLLTVSRGTPIDPDAFTLHTIGSVGGAQILHYRTNTHGFEVSPGKVQVARTRDRNFITNDEAPAVLRDGETLARQAGLPMASYVGFSSSAGSVIADDFLTALKIVFRRVDSDGYEKRGAVSSTFAWENTSGGDAIPTLRVYWDTTYAQILAGDFIEVYRTEQQDAFDLLGDRFRLATTYKITATDVTNGYADFADKCTDDALGADIYTATEGGPSKSNWMPPPSTDVAVFKNATFYAATESWHTRKIGVQYAWGSLSTSAEIANGVGFKDKTATYTSGFPTITFVSASGLAIGQKISHANFPAGTTITNLVGTTATTSAAPTGSAIGGTLIVIDVIEINGVVIEVGDVTSFLLALAIRNAAGTLGVVGLPDFTVKANFGASTMRSGTVTLALPVPGHGPFTVRATMGANYSPPLPTMTETAEDSKADPRTNRVFISKVGQPEAVAVDASELVGDGTLLRMVPTQDSLFVYCSDGIYRINGDGDDWNIEPFNLEVVLTAPDAIDSADNTMFALTNKGFVRVSDAGGVVPISDALIGDQIKALQKQFQRDVDPSAPYTWGVQVACDKHNNEVWLNFNDIEEEVWIATYVWNTTTNTFVTTSYIETAGLVYADFLQSMVVADDVSVYQYDPSYDGEDISAMPVHVRFNPVYGENVGYLKQWIDATMLFERIDDIDFGGFGMNITPEYEHVAYPAAYIIPPDEDTESVVPVLQDYAYNKHVTFGFTTSGFSAYFSLLGVTFRYRTASDTLRQ